MAIILQAIHIFYATSQKLLPRFSSESANLKACRTRYTTAFTFTLVFIPNDRVNIYFQYPSDLLAGKFAVTSVRDLTTGFDSSQADKKALLPASKSTQMITFSYENGAVITLRTSGTEPKIKYYAEMCASPQETFVYSH